MSSARPSPDCKLREEQLAMQALLELMHEEQQLLIEADIDALSVLTPRKNVLVGQLSAMAGLRHGQLAACGFPASEAGMEAWLAQAGEEPARTLWLSLLDQTRQAKEFNRVNGVLLNKHMAHTRAALSALSPAEQSNTTYGPSGQTSNAPTSRRLVVG